MTEATVQIEELTNSTGKPIRVIKISGQLDESNVDEKVQEIYKLIEANPSGLNLIFDLEALEYMNSKSIGYLTDIYGKVTESGGSVAIIKARPNILDILQVVGLTQLIKTYNSREEALGQTTAAAPAPEPVVAAPMAAAPVTVAPTPVAPTPEPAPTPMPAPTPVASMPEEPIQPAAPIVEPTPVILEPTAEPAPIEMPAPTPMPTPVEPAPTPQPPTDPNQTGTFTI